MEKYNTDKLIKVVTNGLIESYWYTYLEEYKILGIVIHKEGFYTTFPNKYKKECPKNHILKDGIVYETSEVILCYQGDYSKTYYFDSYEEAKTFSRGITNNRKWIN